MLPTAKDVMRKLAVIEGEKASEAMQRAKHIEDEKKQLIEKLRKPSGLTREERIKLAAGVIQRAVNNGLTEIEVYRFPNELCTDGGRALNQNEPGWEDTLTGIPREIYELWQEHLKPRGYKIRYQTVEYPGGVPGKIGVTLSWH
ncbi:hypothetical protein [Pseudaminobacter soli (ex Li et al. 2025)]